MKKIVTAAEMREIDRLTTERYATPSLLLMESAARAAAREIVARVPGGIRGKSVLVLSGRGNNGGDGAALARQLCLEGARVDFILFGRVEESEGDARANFEAVREMARGAALPDAPGRGEAAPPPFADSEGRILFRECATPEDWGEARGELKHPHEVVVDALFGTGLTRPLGGLYEGVVAFIRREREARAGAEDSPPLVVSLDIPSGLDADSAQLIGPAVAADLTVTFTAPKPANVLPPAAALNGELVVADIGSPLSLIEDAPSRLYLAERADAVGWLRRTRYAPDSYKNTHGHALVVAGSRDMTGAAVLCADAAMCAGAGLVTAAAPASAVAAVAARLMPEVMTAALPETESGSVSFEAFGRFEKLRERATVVAVGCGLSRGAESTRRFVRELVARRRTPVVVDADGLNALAPWPAELRGTPEAPLVLTPHEGEMLRLLGADDRAALRERSRAAAEFAAAHELILVLKGTRTLVAAPDGRVFVNPTGNAGLGTAGSGDTLTGVITAFLAQAYATLEQEADAVEAVAAAVYVAGLAGDLAARGRGMRALVASDIREHLGAAFLALDPEGELP
ncbi:MAG TPA: NAD(P)H-hydrate dehydratase [Pyrinomonadaceae bacterium]|nr:NAD(P)H-hydrate dehydratase [Pyrinomonadaceae bacterium]